jgi:hypothetical protein
MCYNLNERADKYDRETGKGGSEMRAPKADVGLKAGTKSKGRVAAKATAGKGQKPAIRMSGHFESSHVSIGSGRRTSVRKTGSEK